MELKSMMVPSAENAAGHGLNFPMEDCWEAFSPLRIFTGIVHLLPIVLCWRAVRKDLPVHNQRLRLVMMPFQCCSLSRPDLSPTIFVTSRPKQGQCKPPKPPYQVPRKRIEPLLKL